MENIENIPEQEAEEVTLFADAPYVTEEPEEAECEVCISEEAEDEVCILEEVPCQPKKKRSWKGLKICLAIIGVVALVAVGCFVTAYHLNNYWAYHYNQMGAYMQHEFADLQQ